MESGILVVPMEVAQAILQFLDPWSAELQKFRLVSKFWHSAASDSIFCKPFSKNEASELLDGLRSLPAKVGRPLAEFVRVVGEGGPTLTGKGEWERQLDLIWTMKISFVMGDFKDDVVRRQLQRQTNVLLVLLANRLLNDIASAKFGCDVLLHGLITHIEDTIRARYPTSFKALIIRISHLGYSFDDKDQRGAILGCLRARYYDGPTPYGLADRESTWRKVKENVTLAHKSVPDLLSRTREQLKLWAKGPRDLTDWEDLGKPLLQGPGFGGLIDLVLKESTLPHGRILMPHYITVLLRVVTCVAVYADSSEEAKAEVLSLGGPQLERIVAEPAIFDPYIVMLPFVQEILQ